MATKKKASKKTVSNVRSGASDGQRKANHRVPAASASGGNSPRETVQKTSEHNVERQREALLELRNRVTGQISFLSDDVGHTDDIPPEDRTDEFDREFALSLVSTEQDALYEIDEALRRIDGGHYGVCESCGGMIESNRLRALPFARHCLGCQADLENGIEPSDRGSRSGHYTSAHHAKALESESG